MNSEIHRADWTIPYPGDIDEKKVPHILRPLTHVEHEWDAFPWHLAARLVELLEQPQPSFEYYHLTAFFRARAAMLALKGEVLNHTDLFTALCQYQVQAGGIYRKHLLYFLGAFLKKHNFAKLPDCDGEQFDPLRDPKQAVENRDLIERVMRSSELTYLSTLNFISVAAELEEEVGRHTVGFWVKGAEMPKAVDVPVRKIRHDVGYELLPAPDEVKQLIRAGRPVKKIMVRLQEEFGFAKGPASAESQIGLRRGDREKRGRKTVNSEQSTVNSGGGKRVNGEQLTVNAGEGSSGETSTRSGKRRKAGGGGGGKRASDSTAEKTLAPVVEILQKAILASTPPSRRTWWQNARAAYVRETGPLEGDKWRAVAKMVVTCVIEEGKKPSKDRHCDYVTPLMLRRLLARLNRPGAARMEVESHYAGYLRRRVTEQERNASDT